jgi:hypothetical protein
MDLSISADEQAGPMVATILVFLTGAGVDCVLFMTEFALDALDLLYRLE